MRWGMVTGPLLQLPIVLMGETLLRDTGDGVFLGNGKRRQALLGWWATVAAGSDAPS